jgi:LytS/YehU family sensor histidine kinase
MKRIAIFGIHLSYWIFYFITTILLFSVIIASESKYSGSDDGLLSWKNMFIHNNILPPLIGFYLFYFLVFPSIKRKIKWYYLSLIFISICLLVSIIESSILYFSNISKDINHSLDHEVQQVFYFILSSIIAFVHGILGLFMRAFFDWFNLRKEKEQLTKQNHLIEMELVKAQLNPHFLFNSLNNIDVLIYKDKEQASSYLNKLSDILRYMLFEAKTDYISFDTEFHFIEKYIALHQLRASNSDYVLLKNELKSNNGMVASLVFMPFIENAFKYSSSYKEGNAIQIQFQQNENHLNFVCKNRITKDNDAFTTSNGLGNELLKKRLELIYKEQYTLNFHDENGYFCVALTIPYEAN